jgi:hypothetical protein
MRTVAYPIFMGNPKFPHFEVQLGIALIQEIIVAAIDGKTYGIQFFFRYTVEEV